MSKLSNAQDPGWQNFVSYFAMDWLLWAGMEPVSHEFREQTLDLPPIRLMGQSGHGILNTNHVPFAYTWLVYSTVVNAAPALPTLMIHIPTHTVNRHVNIATQVPKYRAETQRLGTQY